MDDRNFPQAINAYLNHYVQLLDAKAAVVAAGALVVIGLGLSDQARNLDPILRLIGIMGSGVAAAFALLAVIPRTPHSGTGHVFWADIRKFNSAEEYWTSLKALREDDIGREYSRQNFHVSSVLLSKGRMVRRSIIWFSVSCLALALSVVVSP